MLTAATAKSSPPDSGPDALDYPERVTTPGEDRPIFEAEQAAPSFGEQVKASLAPRRGHLVITEGPGAKGVLVGIGKALAGGLGGVLLMVGVLGIGMSLLMGVYVLVTLIGGRGIGIHWAVVPMSLLIFALVGALGYLVLRAVGVVTRMPLTKPSTR